MATIDANRAQGMIARLADLYRGILDSSKTATSPLKQELAIVSNYLELEKMRFGDRLRYEIRVDSTLGDLHAPGLLLQTLAENAVKHGIGPAREGGSILIEIGAAESGLYQVSVRNTGATFTGRAPAAGGGTGLANTARRLDLLYGDLHQFQLRQSDTGETVASLFFTGERK